MIDIFDETSKSDTVFISVSHNAYYNNLNSLERNIDDANDTWCMLHGT